MGAWRHALGREKSALTPTNIGLVRGSKDSSAQQYSGVECAAPPKAFFLQGLIDNLLISLAPVIWYLPRYVIPRVADLDF